MAEKENGKPPMREVKDTLQGGWSNIRTVLEEVGSKAGRAFVSFHHVMAMIGVYVVLSFLTGVWLTVELGSFRGLASKIAYEVATGGSPIPFINDIEPRFPYLWRWLLFFRVLSWLIVPLLVATAVDATYHILEMRQAKALRAMRRRFRRECLEDGVIDPDALEKCVDRKVEDFSKLFE